MTVRHMFGVARILLLGAVACFAADGPDTGWRHKIDERIPLYGHRNWIVIADSAYPAQSRDGIETIVTNAGQLQVLHAVLDSLDHSRHARPIVYTDAELKFVPDEDAPGVSAYRDKLAATLANRELHTIPHEEVIGRLDQAGQTFRVLILKTTMTIPYTSVFLQLDCAYWSPDAERKLRQAMSAK